MKKILCGVLICTMVISVFTGCSKIGDNNAKETDVPEKSIQELLKENETQIETDAEASEVKEQAITDDQALEAIQNYCYSINPSLKDIVEAGQYTVYWTISSSDENEIVVLYRSYTGAQIRYYIDRITGETYVTEFVPGITEEEERTDEHFSVKDYL